MALKSSASIVKPNNRCCRPYGELYPPRIKIMNPRIWTNIQIREFGAPHSRRHPLLVSDHALFHVAQSVTEAFFIPVIDEFIYRRGRIFKIAFTPLFG